MAHGLTDSLSIRVYVAVMYHVKYTVLPGITMGMANVVLMLDVLVEKYYSSHRELAMGLYNAIKQSKAYGVTPDNQQEKELNCPEQDLNLRYPAYMAGALTTKPPRQFSTLGTIPGSYMYM